MFQYLRVPYGPATIPGWFQREMELLASGLEGVVVFYDDIRVSGRTQAEHDERLKLLLNRIKDAGLTLELKKCEFNRSQMSFLGYDIDSNGIHVSEEKVAAISKIDRPDNVKKLQSFLGMLNQYSKFIEGYASIMNVLFKLLRKDVKWTWTSDCEKAFNTAKERLKSKSVLMCYDPQLPLKLSCDASPVGIGSVISHVLPDKTERPIAYASHVLNQAERNYSQIDKEALGLVFGVKHFHQYFFGREFELETDHKPLIYIFGEKKASPRYPRAVCKDGR